MTDILDDTYESDLTDEEHERLILMSEHAIAKPLSLIEQCLVAYWDNERFGNSLIDAPERLQAVFDVLLGCIHQFGVEEVLEGLREAADKVDG